LEAWLAAAVLAPAIRARECELSARALHLLDGQGQLASALATVHAVFLFQAPLAMERTFQELWAQVRSPCNHRCMRPRAIGR